LGVLSATRKGTGAAIGALAIGFIDGVNSYYRYLFQTAVRISTARFKKVIEINFRGQHFPEAFLQRPPRLHPNGDGVAPGEA
jgi:hypothetical protein